MKVDVSHSVRPKISRRVVMILRKSEIRYNVIQTLQFFEMIEMRFLVHNFEENNDFFCENNGYIRRYITLCFFNNQFLVK